MILLLAAAVAWGSTPVQVWDLEQDDGAFVAGGELGQWDWGTVVSGPGGAYEGTRAWAIGLGGSYLNDATEYLEVPLPPLDEVAQPVFSFAHWYAFGIGDIGYIEVDEGLGWRRVTPIYGYPASGGWTGSSAGWELVSVQLPAVVNARVRFVFVADTSGVGSGWFIDQVGVWDGDVTAPHVSTLSALADTEDLAGPYPVSVWVEDDTGVDGVTLHWSTDRGDSGAVAMSDAGGGLWAGELPAAPVDTRVSYHVVATDGANSTRHPDSGERSFRVYLPAPTGLTGPGGRVVATEAELSWDPPVSAHALLGYEVWRGAERVAEPTDPWATVPLRGEADTFVVRARYDVGTGDASEPFSVGAVLPALVGLSPDEGYAGEALSVGVLGQDALFVQDEVAVDLGAGVLVDAVLVRNVDRLVAELRLDEGAVPGARDLAVDGPTGRLTLPGAFRVLDAALRPQILSVEPEHVTQGDDGVLTVQLSAEPAALPAVDLGEGVLVERVELQGTTLRVDFAVAVRAPLGDHEVRVDDGVRRLSGATFEVRDWTPAPIDSCATAGGGRATALATAAALGLLARRRR